MGSNQSIPSSNDTTLGAPAATSATTTIEVHKPRHGREVAPCPIEICIRKSDDELTANRVHLCLRLCVLRGDRNSDIFDSVVFPANFGFIIPVNGGVYPKVLAISRFLPTTHDVWLGFHSCGRVVPQDTHRLNRQGRQNLSSARLPLHGRLFHRMVTRRCGRP